MGSQVMWGSAGQTRVFFLPLGVCEKHTDGYGRSSVSSSGFFSLFFSSQTLQGGGGFSFFFHSEGVVAIITQDMCVYVRE